MKMPPQLLAALKGWIEAQSYSGRAAAQELGISEATLRQWLSGGGVRPSQRIQLQLRLAQYMEKDQPSQEPVPNVIKPNLIPLYNKLCELEAHSPHLLGAVEALVEQLNQTGKSSGPR